MRVGVLVVEQGAALTLQECGEVHWCTHLYQTSMWRQFAGGNWRLPSPAVLWATWKREEDADSCPAERDIWERSREGEPLTTRKSHSTMPDL